MSVGRYREKTEEELVWDDTRTTLVRLIDLEIAKKRRRILNIVLPAAHKRHLQAIKRGELKELESEFTELAAAVVRDIIPDDLIENALGGAEDEPLVEDE